MINFQSKKNDSKVSVEPSPIKPVIKKLIASLICAYIFMTFTQIYPVKRLKGKAVLNSLKITKKQTNICTF